MFFRTDRTANPHLFSQEEIRILRTTYTRNNDRLTNDLGKMVPDYHMVFLNKILGLNNTTGEFDPEICQAVLGNDFDIRRFELLLSVKSYPIFAEQLPENFVNATLTQPAFAKYRVCQQMPIAATYFLSGMASIPATYGNPYSALYNKDSMQSYQLAYQALSGFNTSTHFNHDHSFSERQMVEKWMQAPVYTMPTSAPTPVYQPWNLPVATHPPVQNLIDSGSTPVNANFPQMMVNSTELGFFGGNGLVDSGSTLVKDHNQRYPQEPDQQAQFTDSGERFVLNCLQ